MAAPEPAPAPVMSAATRLDMEKNRGELELIRKERAWKAVTVKRTRNSTCSCEPHATLMVRPARENNSTSSGDGTRSSATHNRTNQPQKS
jgi:hypothetical protein